MLNTWEASSTNGRKTHVSNTSRQSRNLQSCRCASLGKTQSRCYFLCSDLKSQLTISLSPHNQSCVGCAWKGPPLLVPAHTQTHTHKSQRSFLNTHVQLPLPANPEHLKPAGPTPSSQSAPSVRSTGHLSLPTLHSSPVGNCGGTGQATSQGRISKHPDGEGTFRQ